MENLYVDEILICYVNYLCQLMSGQIVKKTDQWRFERKGPFKENELFPALSFSKN